MTRRIDKPDTEADKKVRACIDAADRKCFVVVAGAGSGKTTSLVKALDYIGQNFGPELRRRQQKIACITYTEVAVNEIWTDVGNDSLFHVSTIHSFLWSVVKPFQKDIRNWLKQHIESKLSSAKSELMSLGPRAKVGREKLERSILKLEQALPKIDAVQRFTYESGKDYANGVLGHSDIIEMVPQLIHEHPLLASIISQRYPFLFVDESQDTFKQVVDSLIAVSKQTKGDFCLGFFGDPMQQIYSHGIGTIPLSANWERIEKPENFRSPAKVLSVINRIRAAGDGIQQTQGKKMNGADGASEQGTANFFILPNDSNKSHNLQLVRTWLADNCKDQHWMSDKRESDVRILVIVHRMAATRLGFQELFEAFNDRTSESVKESFTEGTSWILRPFLRFLLPVVAAYSDNRQFDVMNLLRSYCPRLSPWKVSEDSLRALKGDISRLAELLSTETEATVGEVLLFARDSNLIDFDERFEGFLDTQLNPSQGAKSEDTDENEDDLSKVFSSLLVSPARQLWPYSTYINELSPYSTQHGIKGAEFERVIVVLDDEESTHFLYSYNKLLDLAPLSKTDQQNIAAARESVLDRTRRLFYVCCSRATKDLAIVLYTDDVDSARSIVSQSGLIPERETIVLSDLIATRRKENGMDRAIANT